MYSWINGKVVPAGEARLSPGDLGFLRGYSVFDVLPFFGGEPFLFEEHWARFSKSALSLTLSLKVGSGEAREIMRDLIMRSKMEKGTVRTMLSGGASASGFLPEEGRETLCFLIESPHSPPAHHYEEGVKVIAAEHRRFLPQAKTANYIFPIMMAAARQKADAFEILYTQSGFITEASTSNFFIVKNGMLITPKDDILLGITRAFVLRVAKNLGIPTEERPIQITELSECSEAFLTASNKGALPVVRVDDTVIGDGAVGAIAKQMKKEYMRATSS